MRRKISALHRLAARAPTAPACALPAPPLPCGREADRGASRRQRGDLPQLLLPYLRRARVRVPPLAGGRRPCALQRAQQQRTLAPEARQFEAAAHAGGAGGAGVGQSTARAAFSVWSEERAWASASARGAASPLVYVNVFKPFVDRRTCPRSILARATASRGAPPPVARWAAQSRLQNQPPKSPDFFSPLFSLVVLPGVVRPATAARGDRGRPVFDLSVSPALALPHRSPCLPS